MSGVNLGDPIIGVNGTKGSALATPDVTPFRECVWTTPTGQLDDDASLDDDGDCNDEEEDGQVIDDRRNDVLESGSSATVHRDGVEMAGEDSKEGGWCSLAAGCRLSSIDCGDWCKTVTGESGVGVVDAKGRVVEGVSSTCIV